MRLFTNRISDSGPRRHVPRGQHGAALLLLMLILVIASTYIMVTRLQANASAATRAQRDALVLAEARDALIGYAAKDPNRPGELPCPDFNNDGQITITDDYSGSNCKALVGRLPWKSLGLPDLRDSSGEHLWYALSDSFHAGDSSALNSELQGQLSISGNVNMSNVVAIIIAPGAALTGQSRTVDPNDVKNYLEGLNAKPLPHTDFESEIPTAIFNDMLLPVTHDQLFSVVEKRVLGEAVKSLNEYYQDPDHDDVAGIDPQCPAPAPDCDDGYPWLSPFANPATSLFKGVPGTREGHLAYHWTRESPIAGRNPFSTSFSAEWTVSGATTVSTGSNPPPEQCVLNSSCVDPNLGAIGPAIQVLVTDGTCTWEAGKGSPPAIPRDRLNCTGTATLSHSVSSYTFTTLPPSNAPLVTSGTVTRTYQITFAFDASSQATIRPPTAIDVRRRDLGYSGPLDAATTAIIVVTDSYTADPPNTSSVNPEVHSRTLQLNSGSSATITIAGVQYDLDIDNNELPPWVFKNNWQDLLYVAYSVGDAPGATSRCTASGQCLTILGTPTLSGQRGAVIIAGEALAGHTRPSAAESDYFELENDQSTTPNNILQRGPRTSTFNDQVMTLGSSP